MERICHVKDCFSNSKHCAVRFHYVPTDPIVRQKWIELCRVSQKFLKLKTLNVCSKHFRETNYFRLGTKLMLKKQALPSVFRFKYICLESNQLRRRRRRNMPGPTIFTREELPQETEFVGIKIEQRFEEQVQEINPENEAINNVTIEAPPVLKFSVGMSVQLNHFDNFWYTGIVLEIDSKENEMFIEFTKDSKILKEWIRMDSNRLLLHHNFCKPKRVKTLFKRVKRVKKFIRQPEEDKKEKEQSSDEEDSYTMVNIPLFIGQKIEVYDSGHWCIAVIKEIDLKEDEILLKYKRNSKKQLEWIQMNSNRIRVTEESQTTY